MDVPNAKIVGKVIPKGLVRDKGIRLIKNKTNIVGQNPKEKLTPSRNAPSFPLLEILSIKFPKEINL